MYKRVKWNEYLRGSISAGFLGAYFELHLEKENVESNPASPTYVYDCNLGNR